MNIDACDNENGRKRWKGEDGVEHFDKQRDRVGNEFKAGKISREEK